MQDLPRAKALSTEYYYATSTRYLYPDQYGSQNYVTPYYANDVHDLSLMRPTYVRVQRPMRHGTDGTGAVRWPIYLEPLQRLQSELGFRRKRRNWSDEIMRFEYWCTFEAAVQRSRARLMTQAMSHDVSHESRR